MKLKRMSREIEDNIKNKTDLIRNLVRSQEAERINDKHRKGEIKKALDEFLEYNLLIYPVLIAADVQDIPKAETMPRLPRQDGQEAGEGVLAPTEMGKSERVKNEREKAERLEKRREKLKKLYSEDDASYEIEIMLSKTKTEAVKQQQRFEEIPTELLKDVNVSLKLEDDDKRRREAELQLYHQWRNNNPILCHEERRRSHEERRRNLKMLK
ncbi:hypothetical protein QE152_g32281 [Popillia japonica]|uniref:Uncharacterized protein n=1 Tax=Popillia japonica TaxID=7064 RepID=A0AAW1J009_POPJA